MGPGYRQSLNSLLLTESLEDWVVADIEQFKADEEWGGLMMGWLL